MTSSGQFTREAQCRILKPTARIKRKNSQRNLHGWHQTVYLPKPYGFAASMSAPEKALCVVARCPENSLTMV